MRSALALGADLHDALVLARGGEDGFALEDIHADGLLQIDIRAGFNGGDGLQRVPMVGRADEDDIELVFLEHLAVVAVGARRLLRFLPLGGNLHRAGQHLLVRIAKRDDLDGRHLQEAPEIALAIPTGSRSAPP